MGAGFSDLAVVRVHRYRWLRPFADRTDSDVDRIIKSVARMGNHVKPGVDMLELDDPTVSGYYHKKLDEVWPEG